MSEMSVCLLLRGLSIDSFIAIYVFLGASFVLASFLTSGLSLLVYTFSTSLYLPLDLDLDLLI